MQFFMFLALIITLIIAIFAIQNLTVVSLSFIVWKFSGPLASILAITFAAGIFAGIFLLLPAWWRKSKEGRTRKRRIHELEKELIVAKTTGSEERNEAVSISPEEGKVL
ncbi:hypothetical protein BMS3Abin07_00288 [bacterium BMS3Abin07]|nr:hypothetical protein BMS3Abin07_00288 [bacterium BMS3Abin07]GBE31807.1 hypothetical protein BMS3Bbin05_00710 [bacterium BMS3Bbin05]HDL21080.1 LapA family protein [Nitrospirota bacterium]HDO21881.1 LapA family protein [Nitrospirota bacterium]HDZ87531.1 LapA family protein [Nitrospirota bacterium]